MTKKSKGPLIFGTVMLTGLIGFLALYRSSPGELAEPHAKATGVSFITNCRKCHTQDGLTPGCLRCHTEIKTQLDSSKGYHAFILKDKKAECASCHSDHNGRAFMMVNKKSWNGAEEKDFKHPHVTYKLTGKHDALACEKCHTADLKTPFVLKDFPDQPRASTKLGLSQTCASCHKDPHANGLSQACQTCHRQDTFKNTKPLFDHNKFYPLTKGHSGVACIKCHVIPGDRQHLSKDPWAPFDKVKGTSCIDCHSNPHRVDWKKSCESCHKKDASPWSTAQKMVTRLDHAKTAFPLIAPHNKVDCNECHAPNLSFEKKYPNPKAKGYDRSPRKCESCHADYHRGQFVKNYPNCMMCHSEKGFKPFVFTVENHASTDFPLRGRHAQVRCNECHKEMLTGNVRNFSGTPSRCAACHNDVHRGQFAKHEKTTCETCHQSEKSWKTLSFDHNRDSRYKLDDAHEKVACQLCHIPMKLKDGKTFVRYKPLKSECKDCHQF